MSDVHPKDVELYRGLEPRLGADVATMLLARLPPMHEELVTKADLAHFATKGDLADFATKTDLAELATKAEMAELRTEMAEFRLELRGEMQGLRGELKGEIHDAVGSAFRNVLIGLGAIMFAATSSAAVLAGFVG